MGSSPRMRGTLDPAHPEIDQTGIIPAYAGNTRKIRTQARSNGDHPRVCGEHDIINLKNFRDMGSSPRMRGTLLGQFPCGHEVGIIPAYAGNTNPVGIREMHAEDHPRVCGEHLYEELSAYSDTGSSPRMRGTLQNTCTRLAVIGIIPAYAGNTGFSCNCFSQCRDHPRVCGEHGDYPCPNVVSRGSSPRMRGTH